MPVDLLFHRIERAREIVSNQKILPYSNEVELLSLIVELYDMIIFTQSRQSDLITQVNDLSYDITTNKQEIEHNLYTHTSNWQIHER